MFSVGDYVIHQKNGHVGKVIGYGQQILNNTSSPTLKVLVAEAADNSKRGFVEEDLYSVWTRWPGV